MSSQMTIVQYFIPEDKDDEDKYNAYIIYKNIDSLRLSDIRSNFPLPGEYHFRFKFKFNNQSVWIDHSKEEGVLPKYDNKLIMKVNRLNWGKDNTQSQIKTKPSVTFDELGNFI